MKNSSRGLLLVGGIVAVMAIVVFIVGRGGMANLGSNAFGNVCTRSSLESGKVRYEQGALNLIKMSSEKNRLTKIVALGKQEIKKNESQIKKLEKEKKVAENQIKNLEKYIKNTCSGRGLNKKMGSTMDTCETKNTELVKVQKELKQIQNALSKENEQNKKRNAVIKNAESKIRTFDQQIQNITNYRTGYDACRGSISGEVTISGEVFVASISAPTTVNANTPFTVNLSIKNKSGSTATNYTGTVYMWGVNSDYLCFLDDICRWDDIIYPANSDTYTFVSGEVGVHSFTDGFTIKRAGTYRLYVYIPADAPTYYKEDFVNIIVK